MPEVIGIGSINIDLIVGADRSGQIDLTHPALAVGPTDIGSELALGPERIERAIAHLRSSRPVVSAGGSSLNVVAGIAASGAPVDVGFVGVRGRREPPGSDLGGWFRRWGIDDSLVEEVEGPPGLCLSITQGMERTLLTTPGVNDRLGHWIRHHRGPLTDAIGRARIVHLTSLAGLDDLTPLVDLLDDALPLGGPDPEARPRLSCDPGAIWTAPDRPAEADELLARSRQLLVNRRELGRLLGRRSEPDALFDRWPRLDLVVVKGAERIDVLRRDRPERSVPNPRVLTADEIVDDTGSGDAFAAGLLTAQALGLDLDDGVALGMDLARVKLRFPGVTGIDRYAEVWDRFAPGQTRK